MQTITPEQARAELDRRQRARAELARRELERREASRSTEGERTKLQEFRAKYPDYNDLSDGELTQKIHARYYSDMPFNDFAKRFGYSPEQSNTPAKNALPQPKTAAENFMYPIKNALNIQQEEAKAGIESMKKAVEEPGIKNTLMGGLGALQYFFSPVTGVAKGIVGKPIEGAAKGLGVPDQGAEFIGKLGENAAYFVTPGGAVKTAVSRTAGPGFAAARKMAPDAVAAFNEAKELPFKLKQVEEAAPKGNPAASILSKPQLKESVVKDVVDATRASLDTLQFDKSKRLFRNISDFLKAGEVQVQDLPGILKAENITPEEFAGIWTDTISRAGRELNHLSRLSKDLGYVFKDNPGAAEAFNRTHEQYKEGQLWWEKAMDGLARVEDFRRGMLVTQLATTMRNITSQSGRLVLSQFDEAIQTTIRQGMKAVNLSDEATNGINIISAFYSRLSGKGRMQFERILEADAAATHRARLLSQSIHEVPNAREGATDAIIGRLAQMGQKTTYALNILNRVQEHFFRKIAFEAKLKQQLKEAGMDYATVSPDAIPGGMYKKAVDYALEMTFSSSPKSKTGRDLLSAYRKLGLTTVNPFPRFAFANAVPFMLDHSPLGYLKAVAPDTLKALHSGNPEQFARAASRATLGSLMLKSAWHFRQSEYAGERWYQVKLSEDPKTGEAKYMDVRPFAPFSIYFFMAEAMQHPEKMTFGDYFNAAAGINRISGTGLVIVDMLRSKDPKTNAKLLQNFVNEYAGSFTVPARTAKDIVAHFDPEEAKLRDARNDSSLGVLGKAAGNIPYLSQQLPESTSPLSTKPRETETPLMRQATGFSITTKNAVEREVDRLGIGYESIYPKSGFPDADRDISRKMSPIIEKVGPILFNHPFYKHRSDAWKKYLLEEVIKETKDYASKMYASENPEMALQLQYGRLDDDLKAIVEETIKNNPVLDRLKKK